MFKFTLTIATSAFLLTTGTDALFAMEEDHNAIGAKNHMPADIMKDIFIETSKDTNPRHLTSVCKFWFNCIREDNSPQEELSYSTMNPFMQKCMNTYWENQFYNGILRYTPTDGGAAVTSKFSDLKDGIFDLSDCGNTGKYLIITESMDRFFKIGEDNKDKTVIAIMPCYRILQEIKNSPDHPLFSLMAYLNPDKAPVVLLWRDGNDTDLTSVDYLTTAGLGAISSRNLYENWAGEGSVPGARCRKTRGAGSRWSPGAAVAARAWYFMFIFEPK